MLDWRALVGVVIDPRVLGVRIGQIRPGNPFPGVGPVRSVESHGCVVVVIRRVGEDRERALLGVGDGRGGFCCCFGLREDGE